MTREQVYERLAEVFADVFDEAGLALADTTTAADVPGWDSLAHIRLIAAVEDEFNMSFDMKDVVAMGNVGEMVDILLQSGQ